MPPEPAIAKGFRLYSFNTRLELMPSLGFGLERIGLIPLRAPRLSALLALLLTAMFAFGLVQLKSDHSFSGLFRSQSPDFAAYERLKQAFPASERDVLVLVTGEDLLSPGRLPVLQGLPVDLQLTEGVADVISIFSVPKKVEGGATRFLIPDKIGSLQETERILAEARNHPLVKDRFLTSTADGEQTLLFVVNLTPEAAAEQELAASLTRLQDTMALALADSGLSAQTIGAPIMANAIKAAGAHDRVVFNIAGFLLVSLTCALFFRRPTLVIIVIACPIVAIVWSLGAIGLLGFTMSPFMNTIAPLVMVVTFTNAMHMVFALQHGLAEGRALDTAIKDMVQTIGSACVMTSLTTAIALLSLTIVDSDIIRTFGFGTAIAAMVALLAVTFTVPLLSKLLLTRWPLPLGQRRGMGAINAWLERFAARLYRRIAACPRWLTFAGIATLLVTGMGYFQLDPHFRLRDQVPDRLRPIIAQTMERTNLPLTSPVAIVVDAEAGRLYAQETLDAVRELHRLLAAMPQVRSVWSAQLLADFVAQQSGNAGQGQRADQIRDILQELPQQLRDRIANEAQGKWLIQAYFPELDTQQMVAILNRIHTAVEEIANAHDDLGIELTGFATIANLQSHKLINELQVSLVLAVVVVLMVAALAFRSPACALLSVLPNVIPVFVAGSAIYLWGKGLEYASVMALTVAFGLAVDDTIHFMNRFRLERGQGGDVDAAVERTLVRVGPVLAATSVILIAGLGVTLLSEMESTRIFGQLCIVTLAAALISDLLLLPATMLAGRKLLSGRFRS